ncbi:sulfurtransferase [Aureibaculum sp. A20]|uniref:Sulfurtransferase n=1 Tax=Aureibaculum flavum TaxID=2795986 RepID=A0ABS0WM28_9FLAO|nr:sulfurtransferase [Aureibaculum flavum]MBJ2173023.1 sulfurtransferase [Aureibaculum flavum]
MSTPLKINKPLVSVEWLHENKSASNLVILDATLPKVGQQQSASNKIEGIENAFFFDIKNIFSDTTAPFPNTAVTPDVFEREVRKLGINHDDAIVIYDQHGVYSSPRAWWLFKAMGFENVAVLNGGLPEWKKPGYASEALLVYNGALGNFKSSYKPSALYDYKKVLEVLSDSNKLILDARSSDRFKGTSPEPREGLRSGHIPNSKNLPFTELIDDGKLLSQTELIQKFDNLIDKESEILFSCGSGITACILALGAEVAGYKNLAVYDGSWTEWGSLHQLPIELN